MTPSPTLVEIVAEKGKEPPFNLLQFYDATGLKFFSREIVNVVCSALRCTPETLEMVRNGEAVIIRNEALMNLCAQISGDQKRKPNPDDIRLSSPPKTEG